MRCIRLAATINTTTCLLNQKKGRYECYKCPQGARAAAGGTDDQDWMHLLTQTSQEGEQQWTAQ